MHPSDTDKKIAVLHITGCLTGGGAETILRVLCINQAARGYIVRVLYLYDKPGTDQAVRRLQESGCRVARMRVFSLSALKIVFLMARSSDVIHTHMLNNEHYGFLLSRLFRKKWVTTRYLPRISRWRRRWVNALSVRSADAVICISRGVKDFVSGFMPPGTAGKCRLVYPGLDERQMDACVPSMAIRQTFQVASRRLALIPARLVPQKGLLYLLEAIGKVRREMDEWTFIFAGEGPSRKKMEDYVRREGLGRQVRLIGFRPDIHDYIRRADLLILPSVFEGFGMALLEAMLLKKPIIATDIPVIREVVADAALLVPSRDAGALARAMVMMSDSSCREIWAAKAGERSTVFPPGAMVNGTDEVYRDVLTAPGRPTAAGEKMPPC